MPVTIISKTETLEKRIYGTIFYYRRVFNQAYNALIRKHTARGNTNFDEVGLELLQTHLIGWKNLKDNNDKDIPFNVETIDLIPPDILAELIRAIGSPEINKKEEILKNL